MTEQEYDQLVAQWESLDKKRCEILELHDANGDVFFEEEPWYEQLCVMEATLDSLSSAIDAYEEAEMSKLRQFQPPVVDGQRRAPGDFAWDHWEQWARADGISEELARLGRAVIREAYQHGWPDELKHECGWYDDGKEMLRLALEEPDRARIRWQYLLESDGDFHWCK